MKVDIKHQLAQFSYTSAGHKIRISLKKLIYFSNSLQKFGYYIHSLHTD